MKNIIRNTALAASLVVPFAAAHAAGAASADSMAGNRMSQNVMSHGAMGHDAAGHDAMSDNAMTHNQMTDGDSMAPEASDSPMHSDAGIAYIVGGTGDQSQAHMKDEAGDYSLHVTTVTGKAYVSGVHITVMDAAKKTLLDTTADGPMLFANLPKGSYTVVGKLDGKTSRQKVKIGKGKSETITLSIPKAEQ